MLQLADHMGPAENTAGLYVRFEKIPKQNAQKTLAEGHPCFDEVDYITIVVPGDKSSEVRRPVTPDDKERFRAAWERYQTGMGEVVDGIPLREWPGVTRAQVEELAFFKVYTVEQLASVTDGNLRNMGPLLALRQRARDYLERIRSDAPIQRMKQELEARDEKLAQLQAQVEALLKQKTEAPDDAAPRTRKRRGAMETEYVPEVRPLGENEGL